MSHILHTSCHTSCVILILHTGIGENILTLGCVCGAKEVWKGLYFFFLPKFYKNENFFKLHNYKYNKM